MLLFLRKQIVKSVQHSNLNKYTTRIDSAKTRISDKFKFPEKYKGTFLEKWANYWKQLATDYKDVVLDTVKSIRNKPIRASLYGTTLCSLYLMAKNNPDKEEFMLELRNYNKHLMLVHESCHNPISAKHIKIIENGINENTFHWINLGIFTLLWCDNYSPDLGLYKATCNYLQPEYLTFHERILDIGWMNTWWTLKRKMIDYDVDLSSKM